MTKLTGCMALLCLTVCLADPVAGAERRDLLPDGLDLVIRVPNAPGLVEALKQSPLGRMWADEEISAFLGEPDLVAWVQSKEAETLGSEELAALQIEEYKMLAGEIVLGLTFGEAARPDTFGLAHISREDYARSLEMDRRMAAEGAEETKIIRHEFEGVPVIQMIIQAEQGRHEEWQAHVGRTLISSGDRAWVERSILRLRDKPVAEPAESAPGFQITVAGDRLVDRLRTMIDTRHAAAEAQRATGEGGGAPSGMPAIPASDGKTVVSALGLDDVARMAVDVRCEERQMTATTTMSLGNDYAGVLALMDTQPIDLKVAVPYVSDDIYALKLQRQDLGALWQGLPAILRAFSPMAEGMLQMMVVAWGVDLQNDVLTHIDTLQGSVSRLKDGVPESLAFLRLKDGKALASSMNRLFGENSPLGMQMGEALTRADFRGHTIYVIQQPNAAGAAAFGVAGSYLLIGAEEMVRGAMRTAAGDPGARLPFRDSAAYRNAVKATPGGAFQFGVVDWSRLVNAASGGSALGGMDWLETMIKSRTGQGDGNGLFGNLDWSKVPSLEHVAQFLGTSLSYAVEDDGVVSGHFILNYPDEE